MHLHHMITLCLVSSLALTGCGPSDAERSLSEANQQLKQTLSATQDAKDSASQQVSELKQQITALTQKLSLSRETRNTALGKQHALEKKYTSLESQLNDIQSNHSTVNQHLANKQKAVQEASQAKALMAQTLEKRTLELSQLQTQLEKARAAAEESEASLTQSRQKRIELGKNILTLKDKMTESHFVIEQLTAERNQLQTANTQLYEQQKSDSEYEKLQTNLNTVFNRIGAT